MSSDIATDYFNFVAKLGVTKHPGSMAATRELISLCHIGSGSYVLDVGCGVGATPAYLAKTLGCRVVGVDLLESMVEQSRARAVAAGVESRVELRVADARELPFDDNVFDAVLAESVNVFFDDKRQAMSECVRVTKRGGYVGTAEVTWLIPPSAEVAEHYRRMAYMMPLDDGGWRALLAQAGLVDIAGGAHPADIPQETRGRFERYGCRGNARAVLKALVLYLRDPMARSFLKAGAGSISKETLEMIGFGVYAGRKP